LGRKTPKRRRSKFQKWYDELLSVDKRVEIPRICTGGESDRKFWEIHTFADASGSAFAAVVFLRVKSSEKVSVQLMLAKSRVAPIKHITIPRLELLACLIGSRLAATVRRALKLVDVPEFYWTDSSTVLSWIE
jgi:hypothetical protein